MNSRDWHSVALSEVASLQLSSVDKKSKPDEQRVRLCNYTDVYKNDFIRSDMEFMWATATERQVSNCSLEVGDVIITKDSEKYDDIGVPAFVKEQISDLVCGYHLAILRPIKTRIDGMFLFYMLKYDKTQHQFHARANGVTRFGLRKDDIKSVEISVPPLHEQHRIARILGTIDDAIDLNSQMNKTLEEIARGLFKSWFVDFIPVRAKMQNRWRPGESLPGLPADLYDLFPNRLVNSAHGRIPDGWRVGRLLDVALEHRQIITPLNIDRQTPYMTLAHMPRHSISLREWTTGDGIASNKFAFEKGDILFGKLRPYFHKVGVAPVTGVCSTDIVVTKPRSVDWFGFVLGHMSSTEFIQYTDAGSTGTRMPRTNWKAMASYKLAIPPTVLARAFTTHLRPLLGRIGHNIRTSLLLANLRDTQLSVLLGGRWHGVEEYGHQGDYIPTPSTQLMK